MSDPPPTQPTTVVNVHLDNTNYASAGAQAAAVAGAGQAAGTRKSILLAYLIFGVGGWGGFHRVYLRRPKIVRWLALFYLPPYLGTMLAVGGRGFFLVPLALLAADLVSIPGWVRHHNAGLVPVTSHPPPLSPGAGVSEPLVVPASQPSPGEPPSRPARAEDLKTRLLRIAHRGDGKLTVTQAVMETGESFEKVERHLRQMVRDGHIDVDNEPDSGVVVYLFPELVGRPTISNSSTDPEPR